METRDLSDVLCLKFLVSKLLGFGIVAGAAIVKVPQILNIVRRSTVVGMSRTAVYLEVLCTLWTALYNVVEGNPFSTYGESVFVCVQNIIIAMLMWAYAEKGQAPSTLHMAGVAAILGAAAAAPFNLPPQYLPYLFTASTIMFIFARLPQIITNYTQGHTGNLAVLTCFMNFAGVAARIFTTLQEVDDPIILGNFVVSTILNGTILLQCIMYWNATQVKLAAIAAEKKKNE